MLIRYFTGQSVPSKKKISVLLALIYGLVMVILLFGREAYGASVSFNIAELYDKDAMIHNVLNLVMFVSAGILFGKLVTCKRPYLFMFLTVVLVEGIQLIRGRGMFDVVDIILDTSGMNLGYILSLRMKILNIELTHNYNNYHRNRRCNT